MIIVRHPVHAPIGTEELTAALGPLDRLAKIIDIPAIQIPYGTESIDWCAAVDAQIDQIATKYEPELQSTDSPKIIYAGRAPIPLVMHLGLRLGPWHSVEALQPHHVTRSWAWDPKPHPELRVLMEGLPERRQETAGDVVIRVSTSFVVDPVQTRTAVPGERAIAEIDIRSTTIDRDALHHPESIAQVADAFRDALTER